MRTQRSDREWGLSREAGTQVEHFALSTSFVALGPEVRSTEPRLRPPVAEGYRGQISQLPTAPCKSRRASLRAMMRRAVGAVGFPILHDATAEVLRSPRWTTMEEVRCRRSARCEVVIEKRSARKRPRDIANVRTSQKKIRERHEGRSRHSPAASGTRPEPPRTTCYCLTAGVVARSTARSTLSPARSTLSPAFSTARSARSPAVERAAGWLLQPCS